MNFREGYPPTEHQSSFCSFPQPGGDLSSKPGCFVGQRGTDRPPGIATQNGCMLALLRMVLLQAGSGILSMTSGYALLVRILTHDGDTIFPIHATTCCRFAQDCPPPGSLSHKSIPHCEPQSGSSASCLFCISEPGDLPPLGINK